MKARLQRSLGRLNPLSHEMVPHISVLLFSLRHSSQLSASTAVRSSRRTSARLRVQAARACMLASSCVVCMITCPPPAVL